MGNKSRRVWRGWGITLALLVMLITVFPFLALLGIADALIDLRRRGSSTPPTA